MIKYQVLEALQAQCGQPVSGEELSGRLGVSRTAVWKAVEALRQEGYPIHSRRNQGHTLENTGTDIFNLYEIQCRLTPGGVPWNLLLYEELGSTNDEARRLAELPENDRSVVLALRQTGGKGKRGTSFYSPPETGIYFSLIFCGGRRVEQAGELGRAIAAALCSCFSELAGKECVLRDGNVYFGEKKLCGILAEVVLELETGLVKDMVFGIGVHVNEMVFPSTAFDAVSLRQIRGRRLQRGTVAAAMLNAVSRVLREHPELAPPVPMGK